MKRKISKIVFYHYFKFIGRIILFLCAGLYYLYLKLNNIEFNIDDNISLKLIIIFVVVIFIIEMILRMFPSNTSSMGSQKFLKKVFISHNKKLILNKTNAIKTFIAVIIWVAINSVFYVLYFLNIVDIGFMVMLSLAYSICDIICILFYCPFQMWIFKNRCCVNCRIYNWDYMLMFTPLILIPSIYTTPLVVVAFTLLIVWEIAYKVHPERFDENTNLALKCENCQEKLCNYKLKIKEFIVKYTKK
jgi:hypothetical protein